MTSSIVEAALAVARKEPHCFHNLKVVLKQEGYWDLSGPEAWIRYQHGTIDPESYDASQGMAVLVDSGAQILPEKASQVALSWESLPLHMAIRPCYELDGTTDEAVVLSHLPRWGQYLAGQHDENGVLELVPCDKRPDWIAYLVTEASVTFYKKVVDIRITANSLHDSHSKFSPAPYRIAGRINL